jgi:hypothetical protein
MLCEVKEKLASAEKVSDDENKSFIVFKREGQRIELAYSTASGPKFVDRTEGIVSIAVCQEAKIE